ncbi:hypothetical protein CH296_26725 [Rhodococcus sp. 14-2496-1d]|nr:hypothetical protein CH296_26725 [Rhodococcus sp. 14-2496-1d]
MVIEMTGRSLLENPAALLGTVSWARRHGLVVTLDDVGAKPNTVALLPFVSLTRSRSTPLSTQRI